MSGNVNVIYHGDMFETFTWYGNDGKVYYAYDCITQGLLTLTSFIVGTGLDALTQCDKDKTAYYDVYHFVTDNLDVI